MSAVENLISILVIAGFSTQILPKKSF